jgi:sulfur-oxidizing protein SoxY
LARAGIPSVSSDRRSLLLGAAATAAMTDLVGRMLIASAAAQPVPGAAWQDEMRKILGDAKPVDGQLTIEVPEIAENGNMVPFTARAESPMTEADHVRSMHVLATANPVATIAAFHFTPASGVAVVSSRIRLAQTQDVVVLAQHSTGRFLLQRRMVKVTIGGCGG